ncbi:MAG: undecaprenyl diphosphate synthase [Gammaproteobacteria bacterium]|jgi:undecaprenyl diphosphate synthase|nr:undecaprenyl diphosphate synthase [Gammaproteobacteria bacterium]
MHVAIIMDGNGRWATHRGLPRVAGHAEGAKSVRTAVETAARAGIDTLTLYAFSAANWARPPAEIAALMKLFGQYLFSETRRCVEQSICVNVIGRRDRLSENLLRSIEQSERLSASCTGMHLRVAVDYSSQYSIVRAAQAAAREAAAGTDLTTDDFERSLHEVDHSARAAGPVDLLIRTGNERRLSDFLLWECAYAELHFSECLWPDFDEARFRQALSDYAGRQRRFGGLSAQRGDAP